MTGCGCWSYVAITDYAFVIAPCGQYVVNVCRLMCRSSMLFVPLACYCRSWHDLIMITSFQPAVVPSAVIGEITQAFTLTEPDGRVMPVIVDVPHAGRVYPPAFVANARLNAHMLRRSEDAYVDLIFDTAPKLGAALLCAQFPRAFLDVNREPYELDPKMFDGRLPGFANTRSLRVAGGLGTVPRIVGDGQDIYRGRIPVEDALARIDALYRPYHHVLRRLVQGTRQVFGGCVLVDAHSMPSIALEREDYARADIILGDRYGTSAAPWIMDELEEAFHIAGFTTARNRPYAGGFITESYGTPNAGLHSVQIEINRALYMDERSLQPHSGFEPLRAAMGEVMARCIAIWSAGLISTQMAAE
jgi:N-formylglutamate amidohydrolase